MSSRQAKMAERLSTDKQIENREKKQRQIPQDSNLHRRNEQTLTEQIIEKPVSGTVQEVVEKKQIRSKRLKFRNENTQIYHETKYEDDLKIIERGELPPEIQNIVAEIKKILCTSKTINKMCSFYLIEHDGKFKIYVAISGLQSKKLCKQFDAFKRRIAENAILSKIATLIPFSPERQNIQEKNNDPDEFLNRKELFIKFLITTVSYYESQPGTYEELKKKFNLSDGVDEKIRNIKITSKKDSVELAYKKYIQKKIMPKMEFISKFTFEKKTILPMQTKILNDSPFTLIMYDLKNQTKSINKWEDIGKEEHLSAVEGISDEDINLLCGDLKYLWDYLSRYSNFELSHKLAHCAESNLIDYLHNNVNILTSPGKHYMFNIKIGDGNLQLQGLCDICRVNVPEHFNNLHEITGKSTKPSSKGLIPAIQLDSKKEKELEDLEKMMEKIDAKESTFDAISTEEISVVPNSSLARNNNLPTSNNKLKTSQYLTGKKMSYSIQAAENPPAASSNNSDIGSKKNERLTRYNNQTPFPKSKTWASVVSGNNSQSIPSDSSNKIMSHHTSNVLPKRSMQPAEVDKKNMASNSYNNQTPFPKSKTCASIVSGNNSQSIPSENVLPKRSTQPAEVDKKNMASNSYNNQTPSPKSKTWASVVSGNNSQNVPSNSSNIQRGTIFHHSQQPQSNITQSSISKKLPNQYQYSKNTKRRN